MQTVIQTLAGKEHDLGGGFVVRRLLPSAARMAVGPIVFLDHFGPTLVAPDRDIDVRPHPHIGLATVTYLFEGAMVHRDSLGLVQRIEPGAVNWMKAGRGIVHSERKPPDLAQAAYSVHGLQLWVGLPQSQEDAEPGFTHVAADRIPVTQVDGAQVRVLIGSAFGATSPVPACSPTLYLSLRLAGGTAFALPPLCQEQAIYPIDGELSIDGQPCLPGHLQVLAPGVSATLRSAGPAHLMVLGGSALDGPRLIWWNFVASSRERIVRAAAEWAGGRFAQVPDESGRIELPQPRPAWLG
jgi:redox-sensitive bicupin YhaK (pirin superfamily)